MSQVESSVDEKPCSVIQGGQCELTDQRFDSAEGSFTCSYQVGTPVTEALIFSVHHSMFDDSLIVHTANNASIKIAIFNIKL